VTARDQEEYSALRDTIRERGTVRVWIFVAGLVGWSAIVVGLLALALPPIATLVSLVALAATFEGVLALHVGVERVGRYLSVYHDDHWERAAAAFGRPPGAISADPLFVRTFAMATVLNLIPLLTTTPIAQEWIVVGAAHGAFGLRLWTAQAAARRQRQIDAARFQQLKEERS
jgi:uncharacterized membrane protein HdeD (DUF308 family)